MITDKQVEEIRKMLDNCHSPVFLFDDDPDGICSFTLLYRYLNNGYGIIIKNSPTVTAHDYAEKVNSYGPDLVIVLDKPGLDDDFAKQVTCPILWIDHHKLAEPKSKNVHYYNPLQNSDTTTPTTLQAWQIVKEKQKEKGNQDLWIATAGIIGDWHYDEETAEECKRMWPELLPSDIKTAPDGLFREDSKLGKLVKIIYFNLKGKLKDVQQNYKVFTRIEDPFDILKKQNQKGKYLYKSYAKINEEYERLRDQALDMRNDSPFLIAILPQNKYSFSSEMSNEVFYHNHDKIVILGRSSSGYTKGSIRTSFAINLPKMIDLSIGGLDGYGGGHPTACGFKINDNDFEIFLEKFKENCVEALEQLNK